MKCDNCRWFNKNGFASGTGDCVLHRFVCGSGHEACERYEEYEPRPHGTWVDVPKYKSFYVCSKGLLREWIPCSERLPEDLEPVNITWVNHEPEPYYHDIKYKNFVATGIHYRGQWYWYSTTCADYLGEYGSNDIDLVDDAIEIVAWMPLPEPYRKEGEEE